MSINLVKGQKISLTKEDGSQLKRVHMGLGWDVATGLFQSSIDLDASCILLDENKSVVDTVWFGKLHSSDGSIRHSGDSLTGAGDGDDEVINVDLSTVPNKVTQIVFTINSFRGQTFDRVKNCFARLVETTTGKEICIFKLSEFTSSTAVIMAKVYRHNGEWKFSAIGTPTNGRTVNDIANQVVSLV